MYGLGISKAWGSDITGCPAVSRPRAVTAALQGLLTHDCHDSNRMPSCGQAANRSLVHLSDDPVRLRIWALRPSSPMLTS